MSYEVWGDNDDGLDSFREAHEKYLLEEGWLDDAAAEKIRAVIDAMRATTTATVHVSTVEQWIDLLMRATNYWHLTTPPAALESPK